MKIILTGASGLIGSRFEELMFENHEIIPLSSDNGVDITDRESIESYLEGKNADVFLHLAGKTDVDGCETDMADDLVALQTDWQNVASLETSKLDSSNWKGKTSAFAVNSMGTKNIYDAAIARGIKVVYISTDFVFSGNDEFYNEESIPTPVDWYGMTKYLGEKVLDLTYNMIVRLSFPYGYPSSVKKDVVWKLKDLLSSRDEVGLISDQVITPTFIDDIAFGLDFLLSKNAIGIYHLTGGSYHSPMQIGEKLKAAFGLNVKINPSRLEDVYKDKAARPFQSRMQNDKLVHLGFTPKTFDQGLELIRMNANRDSFE